MDALLFGVCIVYITVNVALPVLTSMSRNANKEYDYDPTALIFVVEVSKMLVCGGRVAYDHHFKGSKFAGCTYQQALKFSFPAVIYMVQNNLTFMVLKTESPATSLVLTNARVIMAAGLYRVIVGRVLSWVQLAAMLGLFVGMVVSQLQASFAFSGSFLGCSLLMLRNLLSVVSGLYSEKLLKHDNLPYWLQAFMLYAFGALVNAIGTAATSQGLDTCLKLPAMAWLLVGVHVTNGLAVSAIMKYMSNLTKFVCFGLAVCLQGPLNAYLMPGEFALHWWYFAGVAVTVWASMVYSADTFWFLSGSMLAATKVVRADMDKDEGAAGRRE